MVERFRLHTAERVQCLKCAENWYLCIFAKTKFPHTEKEALHPSQAYPLVRVVLRARTLDCLTARVVIIPLYWTYFQSVAFHSVHLRSQLGSASGAGHHHTTRFFYSAHGPSPKWVLFEAMVMRDPRAHSSSLKRVTFEPLCENEGVYTMDVFFLIWDETNP